MNRRKFILSGSVTAAVLITGSSVFAQEGLPNTPPGNGLDISAEEHSMNSIKDKVVVITGASSGFGEASARLLAEKGARVVLGARRMQRLEQLAAEIKKAGGQALAVKTDVSQRADVENLIKTAEQQFGGVDVLFANAGIMPQAPLYKLAVDEWDSMIDINIKGVLYSIAAVLPGMRARKSGHIINTSSVVGLKVASSGATVYSATKFAVKAISEGLREEVAADGIRVTCLYPGAFVTELAYSVNDSEARARVQEFQEAYGSADADAIARAVVYAMEQPADIGINEITIRPTRQVF